MLKSQCLCHTCIKGAAAMKIIIPKLLKLEFNEISFVNKNSFQLSNHFEITTEHGSDTAVLCVELQNDWVMDKKDLVRFEFKMIFWGISYCNTPGLSLGHYWACWWPGTNANGARSSAVIVVMIKSDMILFSKLSWQLLDSEFCVTRWQNFVIFHSITA